MSPATGSWELSQALPTTGGPQEEDQGRHALGRGPLIGGLVDPPRSRAQLNRTA